MKMKRKGKIHPSPSSSSASLPPPCTRDVLSVLKLLPAAVLALASVLSLEDREVLAYMITRSLDSSNLPSFNFESSNGRKRSSKKQPRGGGGGRGGLHKPPVFVCDCFDCYTSYWLRWDSSPNRELIHQVIEAFEEHLATSEASSKWAGGGKRREKSGRWVASLTEPAPAQSDDLTTDQSAVEESLTVVSVENEVQPVTSPEAEEAAAAEAVAEIKEPVSCVDAPELEVVAAAVPAPGSHHKGLAWKVLPDVMGLLNSRLWNLWSPNV